MKAALLILVAAFFLFIGPYTCAPELAGAQEGYTAYMPIVIRGVVCAPFPEWSARVIANTKLVQPGEEDLPVVLNVTAGEENFTLTKPGGAKLWVLTNNRGEAWESGPLALASLRYMGERQDTAFEPWCRSQSRKSYEDILHGLRDGYGE